ncbi:hypothetical protein Tco_1354210 [Tanacetum coccineum]
MRPTLLRYIDPQKRSVSYVSREVISKYSIQSSTSHARPVHSRYLLCARYIAALCLTSVFHAEEVSLPVCTLHVSTEPTGPAAAVPLTHYSLVRANSDDTYRNDIDCCPVAVCLYTESVLKPEKNREDNVSGLELSLP